MKILLLVCALFASAFLSEAQAKKPAKAAAKKPKAEVLNYEPAKAVSKLMKPAIEAKDAPATCWYLGQVRGFALAARATGNLKAQNLLTLVTEQVGKCGGKNTQNMAETFTPEEWIRLTELQKTIEAYKE